MKLGYVNRAIWLLLCTLLLSVTCRAASEQSGWPNIDYIIESFFEVSLGNEYGQSSGLKLRKWQQPIRIYVDHQVADTQLHNSLLNAQIEHLMVITGLDIKRVSKRSDANLFYFFTKQSRLPALIETNIGRSQVQFLHGSVCIANINTNTRHEIETAYIFIPVDRARMHGKLIACIVEELTQALGLIRDSDLIFPSIFNDKSHNTLLSGLDEILLRLLSEDSVKVGMSAQQLKPILRARLNEYQTQGLIDSAQRRVRQGKLYEMMGIRASR